MAPVMCEPRAIRFTDAILLDHVPPPLHICYLLSVNCNRNMHKGLVSTLLRLDQEQFCWNDILTSLQLLSITSKHKILYISNILNCQQVLPSFSFFLYHMSLVVRQPDFCLCENKGADQLRSNCKADQRLCFCYLDSSIPLLLIAVISSI